MVREDELVYHEDVNLGIAVALDDGLVVPVIRQAQRLSLEGMAAAIADVAQRARDRGLQPDEVHGGTFTITNPGQFGAVLATPIINQPQVAILDLEAIVKRPVVVSSTAATADTKQSDRGDEFDSIAIRPMAYLCMSWDHRALDGAEAARFLGDEGSPGGLGGRSDRGRRKTGDGHRAGSRGASLSIPNLLGAAGPARARGPGAPSRDAQRAIRDPRDPLDRARPGAGRRPPVALPGDADGIRDALRLAGGMTLKAAAAASPSAAARA